MKDYSKFIYIIGFSLVIAAFFVTNVDIGPENAIISLFFILFLALPSFIAVFLWLGWKKGLVLLISLSIYALIIETLAIYTGIPYSEFYYTGLIGPKLWGITPIMLPFAWIPIFIGCIYLASEIKIKKSSIWSIIILSTILLVISDLVLDPAAAALQFWVWKKPGIFYGVPLMNFLGWALSGFIASLLGVGITSPEIREAKPEALSSSLLLIMLFWSAVNFYLQLYIPCLIGVSLIIFIIWSTRGKVGNFEF